ncbi:hypothetical protein [Hymenobacter sp. APR13]|uniref:hypothetical protein n=1 Tax=Hymenobacter sp. APR13 TaxID=1356852 RepID=UPI0004E0876F|nr:hypothetical protein [Hymenobacter sp. APR13]AII53155.1 hypothetical protein N008_14375 [Hymenobacter sp. APR13]
MKPLYILVLALLLPQILLAQFNPFKPGSYILAGAGAVRQSAKLKLRSSELLIAKHADNSTRQLTPTAVASFRIEQKRFVTATNFEVPIGFGKTVDEAFVELLDSGQMVLMRYEYTVGAPMMMGAGGTMSGGGSSTYDVYLLRWANETAITPVTANRLTGGGRKFRDALLPHLRMRDDLAKLVEDGSVTVDGLPALIRALNTGQAYAPITTPAIPD